MKRVLLKFAHFILKKYGVVPLDMKDLVLYDGKVFEIQSCTLHRDFFVTKLDIEMCDCMKFVIEKN